MNQLIKYLYIYLLLFGTTLNSCSKFLEEKPYVSMLIPSSTVDLQALLDNPGIWQSDPALLEILADDYYVSLNTWQNLAADQGTNHIWASDAIPHNISWINSYQNPIYSANVVLDHLATLGLPKNESYNIILGTALFYRANAFFNLAQVFAKPYDASTLSEPGIVLRVTSDINAKSTRATIEETYEKILTDLKKAADLLPEVTVIPGLQKQLLMLHWQGYI